MHLFCNRLERLYRLAYPRRKVNQSKTLIDKYTNCVPTNFKKVLKSLKMNHSMKGESLKWEVIKQCARHFDVENAKEMRNNEEIPQMRVNLNQTKMSDACVQVSELFSKEWASRAPQNAGSSQSRQFRSYRGPGPQDRNTRRLQTGLPAAPQRGDASCRHCGRMGHFARECRKLRKECFICGSANHYVRQCPVYRPRGATSENERRTSSQPPQDRRPGNYATSNRRASDNSGPARPGLNSMAPAQVR